MAEIMNNTKSNNYKPFHYPSREELHKSFGGKIEQSDFNTDYKGKDYGNGSLIAARISCDMRFDKKCIKNAEYRRNRKNGRQ